MTAGNKGVKDAGDGGDERRGVKRSEGRKGGPEQPQ